jgi:putative glutamine amidotransferase
MTWWVQTADTLALGLEICRRLRQAGDISSVCKLVLFATLVFCGRAEAQVRVSSENATEIAYVISGINGLDWLIPAAANETAQGAFQRYLTHLQSDAFVKSRLDHKTQQALSEMAKQALSGRRVNPGEIRAGFVVIANSLEDFRLNSYRLRTVTAGFETLGLQPLVIPMAADMGLDQESSRKFIDLVVREASLILALGGDDVDPSLYLEPNTHSVDTMYRRDRFEVRLLGRFLRDGLGFLSGICRGHQLTAVAAGYKLIQDLPALRQSHLHGQGIHEIAFRQDLKHGLFRLHDSRTSRSESAPPTVNSWHHQSVLSTDKEVAIPLTVAAVSPDDGVIEALVGRRVLTTQYHWELMDPRTRLRYQSYLASKALKYQSQANRCFALFDPAGSLAE